MLCKKGSLGIEEGSREGGGVLWGVSKRIGEEGAEKGRATLEEGKSSQLLFGVCHRRGGCTC